MLILIIEDEKHIRTGIASMLNDEAYSTLEAEDITTGIALIEAEEPDIILCDIHLPDGDGFRILHFCQQHHMNGAVIFMTAFGNRELAMQAIKEGAYDYIAKPVRFDELFARLHRLCELQQLRGQVRRKTSEKIGVSKMAVLGDSESMQHVRMVAEKAAASKAPVLITGETGVGKGLLAKLIHATGPQATQPFVAINCASIPETLLESELFGYRKGAFTGADEHKKGLFDEAGKGTLFLDEIGDMPLLLQAKLLHVLDDGSFRPLGGARTTQFAGRIIAATNIPPETLLKGEKFRTDLFYRLSVITLTIPPLRMRPDDVLALAARMYHELQQDMGHALTPLPTELAHSIQQHDWPGNVRELRNMLERSMILGLNNQPQEESASLAHATSRFEQAWIQRVIHECNNDKAAAAKRLGIGVSTLYRKLEPQTTTRAPL